MKEKQLTIDDYNNEGNLVTSPIISTEEKVDTVEVETVDYNTLTKAELLKVVEAKDTAVKNYEDKLNMIEEKHNKELHDVADYFKQEVDAKSKIIAYYERKFKLLKDILVIEKGEE